jgi:Amidohydrolase
LEERPPVIIIDSHVHISGRDRQTGEVLRKLKRYDVDSAVIFADAESADLEASNRYVLLSGQEFDCYPFYYLGGNPFTDTRMDLEIPVNLEDFAGIRWHGWFAEFEDRTGRVDRHELEFAVVTMESPEFIGLMSALSYYGKPIMFEEDFAVTLEFVRRFPELKIIIPHMGLLSGGEEQVIGQLYRERNVSFTTSHGTIDPVTLRRLGPERLLYASDFPHGSPAAEIEKIKRLEIGDEDEALVFGENIERILNRELDEDEDLEP